MATAGRKKQTQLDAQEKLRLWREKPDVFVREVFNAEPDPWQDEALRAFPHKSRMALAASKGPGKTTLLAWLGWNFLLTRPSPKIAATSVTGDNLADGLWAEMKKWQNRSPLLTEKFEWTKSRIFLKSQPETWFMTAKTWSKSADAQQQADTLAGFHEDYILFLIDESGSMPRAVIAAAEAALSSCVEGHLIQAGNCSNLESPLYDACTKDAALWHLIRINGDPDNPKRSSRISLSWAREQIQLYGRDNPFVLVNVLGQFPPHSFNALIGPDEVQAAMDRRYNESDIMHAARVLGLDTADMGDDANVLFPRQGLQAFPPQVYRHVRGSEGAGFVARKWEDWDADAVFVDNTGGYGATWVEGLEGLGRNPFRVQFSGAPYDNRYHNKRAEMYFEAVEWIRAGGALPECPELKAALTKTSFTIKGDKFLLQPKEQVKQLIGYSPDHADAFVLTFAEKVVRNRRSFELSLDRGQNRNFQSEHDPFAESWTSGREKSQSNADRRYRMPHTSNWES